MRAILPHSKSTITATPIEKKGETDRGDAQAQYIILVHITRDLLTPAVTCHFCDLCCV